MGSGRSWNGKWEVREGGAGTVRRVVTLDFANFGAAKLRLVNIEVACEHCAIPKHPQSIIRRHTLRECHIFAGGGGRERERGAASLMSGGISLGSQSYPMRWDQ